MVSENTLKRSRFFHVFQRSNVAALVHGLNLGVVYVEGRVGDEVFRATAQPVSEFGFRKQFGDHLAETLLHEKLLVRSESEDESRLLAIRDMLHQDLTLELLYLLVTDNCNLKCAYCFEDAPVLEHTFRPQMMSEETAKDALNLFGRMVKKYGNPRKFKMIHLYGGEPLMNKPVVKAAILHAEQLMAEGLLPEDSIIAMVSNGMLVDEDTARFLGDHHVSVGLSLDGPREINNIYRIGKKRGEDVWQGVMQAYHLLRKHGAETGFSVTLTPEAVENFDQVLEFFLGSVDERSGLSLNLLNYSPTMNLPNDYYTRAVECQIKAFQEFRKRGIHEERMMRKAKAFAGRNVQYSDCGVTGEQFIVAPDGAIGVCQDFIKPRTYFSATVRDEDPIAAGLFGDWRKRSPLFMPDCMDCPALGFCGGGCGACAEVVTGNKHNVDKRICPHSLMTLQWLVWETYNELQTRTGG